MAGIQASTSSAELGPRRFQRIEEPLFHQARRLPRKHAVVDGEHTCTYEVLADRARRMAGRLCQRGIQTGDRVAIYLDKSLSSVVALYGTWTAGAIAVPVNEGLRTRQLEHVVRHSGARIVVSHPRNLARIAPAALADAAFLHADDELEDPLWQPHEREGGREPAALLYTSGSTGLPKGILVSHENLLAGTRIVAGYLEIQEDDRILAVLPLSFDYGLNQLLTAIDRGATLFLQRSPLPGDIHRALVRHRITGLAGVPPLWIQLLGGRSPLNQDRLPDLRYITNSGGVFPTDLVAHCRRLLPATRLYLMYGLSEAFRSTYLPPDELDRRPGSMGRAMPETEIYVLDERGRPCAPDEVGELVHAGPTVALGYWRDPEATAAVFRESPLAPPGSSERVVYSGDLVRSDDDGYLYFVGRRDQLIKCQGFRVSPDEVEETLHSSGLLAEVAVCGIPDPNLGQAIVAHVVPRDPAAFTEESLLGFCRREMPAYMVPRAVRTHVSLPRTPSGKLDRKALG